METQLTITDWTEGRLAISGRLPDAYRLIDRLRGIIGVKIEYRRNDDLTVSFPIRFKRDVIKIVENLE